MVKVENLVKRYGTNYALNDVSFEIGEGEIVGLLGPNGAGKSTAMNIITGYLSSTSGEVYIDGINMLEDPIKAKKLIGFLIGVIMHERNVKYIAKALKCDVSPKADKIII